MDLNNTFRPSKWEEVKGQDKTINTLKTQILSEEPVHAYIFSGKSGVGKTTIARLLLKALNCEHISKTGNPCGKCASCLSPQLSISEINASNTRGIDDMREIINSLAYIPSSKYMGVILDEAHMLSKPAWNCLLKPIEEAISHVIWILCTTEPGKIPKTIQTRCQIYQLNPLKYTDIYNRLKEIQNDIPDDICWTIARNSDSNLRQAIKHLEKYLTTKDISQITFTQPTSELMVALINNDMKTIWKALTAWEKSDTEMDVFLNNLKYDLIQVIKAKIGLELGLNPFKVKQYQELAAKIPEDRLLTMLNLLLGIEEKLFGVYDYNSLFLKALCEYRNYFG